MSKSQRHLSIGEVARETGVSETTLRAWERRFGFPEPNRRSSGHRRYGIEEIEQIRRVVAERRRGMALMIAIQRAREPLQAVPSLFARLRERRPQLQAQRVDKRRLLALSRAILDESAARAEPTILIGSFQQERYYRQSERRWRESARGPGAAFVFAEFDSERRPAGGPAEVPLATDHPALREWALICAAPGHGACLVGWETPGRKPARDATRHFELLFSLEPGVVREAVSVAASIIEPAAPDLAEATRRELAALDDPSPESQLRLSAGITARMLGELSG